MNELSVSDLLSKFHNDEVVKVCVLRSDWKRTGVARNTMITTVKEILQKGKKPILDAFIYNIKKEHNLIVVEAYEHTFYEVK